MFGNHPDEDLFHSCIGTAMNNTNAVSLIAAAGTSLRWNATKFSVGNISSVVDTILKIFDGTALKHSIPVPRGRNVTEDWGPDGIPFSANSAITVQLESAADCRFSIHGYRSTIKP